MFGDISGCCSCGAGALLVGMHILAQPLWRPSSVDSPQEVKDRATTQSSNSTSRYLSEENEDINLKTYLRPTFTAALFTKAKITMQLKCPLMDEWIKKKQCMYTMECFSAIKT